MATGSLDWNSAIIQTLEQSAGPLHYSEIAERISESGLRKNVGANPASLVSQYLGNLVGKDTSKIIRLGKGNYVHKNNINKKQENANSNPEHNKNSGIIRAFGVYWSRNLSSWKGNPKILGLQQTNSKPVDFCNQEAVYILYDRHEAVYAGQATEKRLGNRLLDHTKDRLSSRWDRYSWFGLLDVGTKGELINDPDPNSRNLLTTLESLIIEILETPLNRRRGDDLNEVEYYQYEDPDITKRKNSKLYDELIEKIKNIE